jgi:hypothetical protein
MGLWCGHTGCFTSGDSVFLEAHSDPAACPAIGPGKHEASFWFSSDETASVGFDVAFYSEPGCTGEIIGGGTLGGEGVGLGWQKSSGTVLAPLGTQSASYHLGASEPCEDFCAFSANFDDLDVEAEVSP